MKRGRLGVEIPDKSYLCLIILRVSVICLLYKVSILFASGGLWLCCCAESLECCFILSKKLNYHSCCQIYQFKMHSTGKQIKDKPLMFTEKGKKSQGLFNLKSSMKVLLRFIVFFPICSFVPFQSSKCTFMKSCQSTCRICELQVKSSGSLKVHVLHLVTSFIF